MFFFHFCHRQVTSKKEILISFDEQNVKILNDLTLINHLHLCSRLLLAFLSFLIRIVPAVVIRMWRISQVRVLFSILEILLAKKRLIKVKFKVFVPLLQGTGGRY